jgi:hypothetical protein
VRGEPELALDAIGSADGAPDGEPTRAGGPFLDLHRATAEAAPLVVDGHRIGRYAARRVGDNQVRAGMARARGPDDARLARPLDPPPTEGTG